MEKRYTMHKELGVTILTSDTVDFKTNNITRDREASHKNN